MKMENKRLLESTTGPQASGSHLKALIICHTQAECVELQAALAPLEDVTVEAIATFARLPGAMHKSVSVADLVLIDIDPDSAEDISLLRQLRQVAAGLGTVPIIAVTSRLSDNAPLRLMRAGADDLLSKPIQLEEAREVLGRAREHAKSKREAGASLGKALVFMHLSGGAGATTLAVNAATALGHVSPSKQACLLDLDIQLGNAASLLDISLASPMQDFIDDPQRIDAEMLQSMMVRHPTGLQVLTAPRTLFPFSAYGAESVRSLIELAKRRFDYVVIDLPVALAPWTDAVLKLASVIYLVVPLSVPSAHRTVKFLEFLREEGITDLPLKLVGNRHHRGKGRGNEIAAAQFQKAIGRKIDFLIPNDYSLVSLSHSQGNPAVRLKPNSAFTSALTEMLAHDLGKDVFPRPRRGLFSFRKA
jgi:pilus assembly protein CpaE